MFVFDLYTISTHFQPKRVSTNATYTFCAEGSFDPTEEVEDLVGQEVSARYKQRQKNKRRGQKQIPQERQTVTENQV